MLEPKILTICSTKGGVGKTTLTANLGGFLASHGKRVLFVDADSQPSLTFFYGHTYDAKDGLVNLITGEDLSLSNTISKLDNGCDLVRSDDHLARLPEWMLKRIDGRLVLKQRLERLKSQYDYILVDTQGARGVVQDSAVIAADLLLTPIPPDTLSARELDRSTIDMVSSLKPITTLTNITIAPLYGLFYRVDRTNDSKNNIADLRAGLAKSNDITLMESVVSSSVAWREAATQGVSVDRLRKNHALATLELMAVADELKLLGDAKHE